MDLLKPNSIPFINYLCHIIILSRLVWQVRIKDYEHSMGMFLGSNIELPGG